MNRKKPKIVRRILISAPRDQRLQKHQVLVKDAILDRIRDAGFEPQVFLDAKGGAGLAAGAGWSVDEVEKVARRCVGAAIIGLQFWKASHNPGVDVWLPSEYSQFEGAIARSLSLPILAIDVGIEKRIIFDDHAPLRVARVRPDDPASLKQPDFTEPFEGWLSQIDERKDVFLGYCSRNRKTAMKIKGFLDGMGVKVEDYASDFKAGASILDEIEKARAHCTCGIFLFAENDPLVGDKSGGAAPRDNVVFEAGYFMSAKGPEGCLIVRQGSAKMPADLGGAIYVALRKGENVSGIQGRLRQFVEQNL
jgi:hypothetical protein